MENNNYSLSELNIIHYLSVLRKFEALILEDCSDGHTYIFEKKDDNSFNMNLKFDSITQDLTFTIHQIIEFWNNMKPNTWAYQLKRFS